MEKKANENRGGELPSCAAEFIRQVIRMMRYRERAAKDVEAELTSHFEDELHACTNAQERQHKAQKLIEQFGDARLLAILCRRAKKRCRPLWAKAIVRTAQGVGVLVLLFIVYTGWFLIGKPSPRVDYVAIVNQMSRPQIAEQDNAWTFYKKAIAAFVDLDNEKKLMPAFEHFNRPENRSFSALPEETRTMISQWVEQNETGLREFATAAAMSYCCRPYAADPNNRDPWVMDILLPHLAPLRDLARLAVWRSRIELERGDVRRALEDCLTLARAGRHWQHSRILIEQLVGLALSQMGHQEMLRIVHVRDLPVSELAGLQQQLTALYPGQYPLIDVEAERLAILDVIQRVFTEGGLGGGRMAFSGTVRLCDCMNGTGAWDDDSKLLEAPVWAALSMVHAGRTRTTAKANWLLNEQAKLVQLSPYQKHTAQTPDMEELLKSLPGYRYAILQMMFPSLRRAADIAFRGKAMHEATMTVLALQRYHAEKGSYPASLDALKQSGYIDAAPSDPYSNGPLVYEVAGDRFILYSVGTDFKDDGGTPGTDRKGRRQLWDTQAGDAVFWPGDS
ncbi:MAG: hypothetical protein JW955_11820 [Sedimentisphaerales bacterium]|nr:hypothetical protein [Sedimentisphaerales bacterium]